MVQAVSAEPFTISRTHHSVQKFERDVEELQGNLGIGCISDFEPQPLLIQSHLGSFAITTVGKNLIIWTNFLDKVYAHGHTHFQEMSGGQINATELIASLICQKDSLVEGIQYVQEIVDGSMTLLLMTKDGLYAARDRRGRTPLVVGHKKRCLLCLLLKVSHISISATATTKN